MRKIEFRGKSMLTGELIYGGYFFDVSINEHRITHYNSILNKMTVYTVYPETVGQFTGILDKNCKEIYEGDIVHLTKIPAMDKLKFYADPFEIRYKENGCQFYGHRDGWLHDTYLYSLKEFEYEIIGNIHDNPELLGKEATK